MNKQFLKTKKLTPDELAEKSLNVWISADLKERVDVHCKREDDKIRKVVAEALRQYLKKHEKKHGLIDIEPEKAG